MAVGDFWGTTACLCLLAFVVGCSEPASTATVSGVVTLDGKPLEFIHVEFWPENGQRSFGKTDSEGRFELLTDDRSTKGAVPGTHKVSLRDTLWVPGTAPLALRSSVTSSNRPSLSVCPNERWPCSGQNST